MYENHIIGDFINIYNGIINYKNSSNNIFSNMIYKYRINKLLKILLHFKNSDYIIKSNDLNEYLHYIYNFIENKEVRKDKYNINSLFVINSDFYHPGDNYNTSNYSVALYVNNYTFLINSYNYGEFDIYVSLYTDNGIIKYNTKLKQLYADNNIEKDIDFLNKFIKQSIYTFIFDYINNKEEDYILNDLGET